jgi:hypothetical protein
MVVSAALPEVRAVPTRASRRRLPSMSAVKNAAKAVYGRLPGTWPLRLRLQWEYYRMHGRPLSFSRPVTFTEKVHWRMVNDRREVLVGTCDKLRMKELALAAGVPGLRVPQTYWSGTDLRELPDVDLPERWVLKPNHRFGLVELSGGRPDITALHERTAGWLEETQSVRGEWAYGQARRCFLVEEMIDTQAPDDYKFFVFAGTPRMISLHTSRFAGHRSRLYSTDWEPVGGHTARPLADLTARPEHLDEMLHAASVLGAPYDFMRVDLYYVDGQIWFSELTPYPGAGKSPMDPPELDAQLGSYWRLPAEVGPGTPAVERR